MGSTSYDSRSIFNVDRVKDKDFNHDRLVVLKRYLGYALYIHIVCHNYCIFECQGNKMGCFGLS